MGDTHSLSRVVHQSIQIYFFWLYHKCSRNSVGLEHSNWSSKAPCCVTTGCSVHRSSTLRERVYKKKKTARHWSQLFPHNTKKSPPHTHTNTIRVHLKHYTTIVIVFHLHSSDVTSAEEARVFVKHMNKRLQHPAAVSLEPWQRDSDGSRSALSQRNRVSDKRFERRRGQLRRTAVELFKAFYPLHTLHSPSCPH